eukprot:10470201-Prorocentrum_lima.AAC.1
MCIRDRREEVTAEKDTEVFRLRSEMRAPDAAGAAAPPEGCYHYSSVLWAWWGQVRSGRCHWRCCLRSYPSEL